MNKISLIIIASILFFFALSEIYLAQMDSLKNAEIQSENAYEDEFELVIIESFITPDEPFLLKLKFVSSLPCKTKVRIESTKEYVISDEYSASHQIEIPIKIEDFDKNKDRIEFQIISITEKNDTIESEMYEAMLPQLLLKKNEASAPIFSACLLGSALYLFPSGGILLDKKNSFYYIGKEFPLLAFYRKKAIKPNGLIFIEYNYVFNYTKISIGRIGFKYLFNVNSAIDFISIGSSYDIDFKGNKGFSLETTSTYFKFFRIFSFYAKVRYTRLIDDKKNIFDAQIGIHSNFFTIRF